MPFLGIQPQNFNAPGGVGQGIADLGSAFLRLPGQYRELALKEQAASEHAKQQELDNAFRDRSLAQNQGQFDTTQANVDRRVGVDQAFQTQRDAAHFSQSNDARHEGYAQEDKTHAQSATDRATEQYNARNAAQELESQREAGALNLANDKNRTSVEIAGMKRGASGKQHPSDALIDKMIQSRVNKVPTVRDVPNPDPVGKLANPTMREPVPLDEQIAEELKIRAEFEKLRQAREADVAGPVRTGAAPAAAAAVNTFGESDIQMIMADPRAKGLSRQQVIDRLKSQGKVMSGQ